MKTEMYVVSSYEISPSCSVDSGFIRVGEKSSKTQRKSVYTMDEALAKLKRVLREMKSQDKDIYRQLMTLNSNITRLKKEIAGEEEKRQQNDMELEYDIDSVATDDDSCSDFEISDLDTDDIKCIEDSNQSSGIESGEIKDADSDSIHERFDSGIQEDASYNLTPLKSGSPTSSKPKMRGTSWNGERSSMYNFLLTKLPGSDDSQENSDIEESKSKLAPTAWDQTPKKQQSAAGEIARGTEEQNTETVAKTQALGPVEAVSGSKAQDSTKIGVVKEHRSRDDGEVQQAEKSDRQHDEAKLTRTVAKVQARSIVKHRRTQSEDQTRPDINANYIIGGQMLDAPAQPAYTKRNLDYISENEGKGTWNAFDARNYRGSERLVRREILPIRGVRINQQLLMQESHDKNLTGSLTQLNIDRAISSNAVKAIRRSTSSLNSDALSENTLANESFTRSWTMPRNMVSEASSGNRMQQRFKKTVSAYIPRVEEGETYRSEFVADYVQPSSGIVSTTVSLV